MLPKHRLNDGRFPRSIRPKQSENTPIDFKAHISHRNKPIIHLLKVIHEDWGICPLFNAQTLAEHVLIHSILVLHRSLVSLREQLKLLRPNQAHLGEAPRQHPALNLGSSGLAPVALR